jgi:transposase
MKKTRTPYPPEFRQKMVDLVLSGRSPEDLEKEFEPTSISIRNWVAKARGTTKQRPSDPVDTDRQELEKLRREVRILREERDILKKAAAWFAQETGTPSSKRSSS